MAENAVSGMKIEKSSSTNVVETTEFTITVACEKSADGSRHCLIKDISIDEPFKDPAHEVAVGAPQKDTSIAAAPRKLSNEKGHGCDLCEALADALKEKVAATTSPRRMHSPVGRRSMVRS